MYTYQWKHLIILLNNNLDVHIHNIVLAYEIGHDNLHRNLATIGLKEFNLFDTRNITEYEANVFAAHLLLHMKKVTSCPWTGYNIEQIACILNSHMNSLLIKMQEINRLLYDFRLSQRCFFEES